jgi:RNA polymerase sigma factor (sigma-70 family)
VNLPLMEDDVALLRRYRSGDAAAFAQLYERHRLGLFRFILGLCGDQSLAEEVFQDTWMSLIRTQSDQREAVLFKTWLYQIARNRLIDHWRKNGRHQAGHYEYDETQHARNPARSSSLI